MYWNSWTSIRMRLILLIDSIVQPTACSRCSTQTCNKNLRGSPLQTGVSHVPLMHFMKRWVDMNPGSHSNIIVFPSWKVCLVCFSFPWWTLGRAPHSSSPVKTDTFQCIINGQKPETDNNKTHGCSEAHQTMILCCMSLNPTSSQWMVYSPCCRSKWFLPCWRIGCMWTHFPDVD